MGEPQERQPDEGQGRRLAALPGAAYRDANASAMLDMLDLRRPSFAEPPELDQPLAVSDPSALSCSVTGPGTIPPPGSVTG